MPYPQVKVRLTIPNIDVFGTKHAQSLPNFLEAVENFKQQVPENLREKILIDVSSDEYYGSVETNVEIYYWREMTKTEREEHDQNLRAVLAQQQVMAQRQLKETTEALAKLGG